jgi:hypothetical protein
VRIAFDDEGAGGGIEFVRVRGKHSLPGFAECQRQAVKQLMRTVPDIFIGPRAEIGFELIGKLLPDGTVYAIGAHE